MKIFAICAMVALAGSCVMAADPFERYILDEKEVRRQCQLMRVALSSDNPSVDWSKVRWEQEYKILSPSLEASWGWQARRQGEADKFTLVLKGGTEQREVFDVHTSSFPSFFFVCAKACERLTEEVVALGGHLKSFDAIRQSFSEDLREVALGYKTPKSFAQKYAGRFKSCHQDIWNERESQKKANLAHHLSSLQLSGKGPRRPYLQTSAYKTAAEAFVKKVKSLSSEEAIPAMEAFLKEELKLQLHKPGQYNLSRENQEKRDRVHFCIAALAGVERLSMARFFLSEQDCFASANPLLLEEAFHRALNEDEGTAWEDVLFLMVDHYIEKGQYEKALEYARDPECIASYIGDLYRKRYAGALGELRQNVSKDRVKALANVNAMISALDASSFYYGKACRYDGDPEETWNLWPYEIDKRRTAVCQFWWNTRGVEKAILSVQNPSLKALMTLCSWNDERARELKEAFFDAQHTLLQTILQEGAQKNYKDFKTFLKKKGFKLKVDPSHTDAYGSTQHIWYKTFVHGNIQIHLVVRVKKEGEMTIGYTVGEAKDLADPYRVTEFAKVADIAGGSNSHLFLVPAFPEIYLGSQTLNNPRNPLIAHWTTPWEGEEKPYELKEAHFPIPKPAPYEWNS